MRPVNFLKIHVQAMSPTCMSRTRLFETERNRSKVMKRAAKNDAVARLTEPVTTLFKK